MRQANIIGDIGENTFALRLSKEGIFKVYFLGEKAPIVDFILEIIDEKKPYQCLVQVKSIGQRKKYRRDGWMRTPVPQKKLEALIARPLPTYVAGVDVDKEIVYMAPAYNEEERFPAIPPKLKFDRNRTASQSSLKRLRDDIINYWEKSGVFEKLFKNISKILLCK